MTLKSDVKSARDAVDKLQTYCAGLPKKSQLTPMYHKLNAKADAAIKKLPKQYRSQLVLDLSRLIIK